ncbi:MAG: Uma2 family endonuclease [Saprospiraceae bacterium]
MDTIEEKKYTAEEYFSIVAEAEYKMEYYRGQIFAMAGAKPNHNIISLNVGAMLYHHLLNKECTVFNSDQALAIADDIYFYPDIMVSCGEVELDQGKIRLLNPVLIVEILSKSTQGFDKGKKFTYYRQIPSLKEYLMLDAEAIGFESYYKEENELWRISSGFKLDQSVPLYSLDLQVPLEAVYKKTIGLIPMPN